MLEDVASVQEPAVEVVEVTAELILSVVVAEEVQETSKKCLLHQHSH